MNFSEKSCEDFSNDSTILVLESFRKSYIPTISIIGCLGNILSLFVLSKIKDCFHRLLFVLALVDLMVPLFCTFLLLLDLLQHGKMEALEIIPNALLEAGFAGSGWMTVSISFERFLGICHPMHCPPANRKARFFVLPVLLIIGLDFGLSVALLEFFGPVSDPFVFDFLFYFHILIQYILPAAILLILNTIIAKSVIRINSDNFTRKGVNKIRNSAAVLIIVVFVYILCWSPFYVIDFTFVVIPYYNGCLLESEDARWVDRWVQHSFSDFPICISYLSHICISYFSSNKIFRFWVAALRKGGSCAIITNSCINFVIYCFVGRTFRRRFISTFSWVANSNCLGRGNIAENGGETFPLPGTNKRERKITENITISAKEKPDSEENPQRNLVKTQENGLVPTAGQDQESLVNLEKSLGNPNGNLGKLQRSCAGQSKADNGVSLQESLI